MKDLYQTQIVYCQDDDRPENHPITSFDFLGFTFRPRRSKNRWGKYFINFSPAISNKSALYPALRHPDRKLVLWATRKFKRLRRHRRRATRWLKRIARRHTGLFAHWHLLYGQAG